MFKKAITLLRSFVTSSDFLKAVLVTFGIVLPIVVGVQLDALPYFLSIAIGVFLTFSSDVPGSRKHKSIGILSATAIAMIAFIATKLASQNILLLYPVLALLIFGISYISVYGFRASLISFSGLLAIVLSFANKQANEAVFIHGMLIGVGGLWALLLSSTFHSFLQKRQIENALTDCLRLTARYVRVRGQLYGRETAEAKLKNELYELQVKLNTIHESLRELLLNERRKSGLSNYKRKQLLIFIELIDMFELALANPANLGQIDYLFNKKEQLMKPFAQLVFELAARLEQLAFSMENDSSLVHRKGQESIIEECHRKIQQFVKEKGLPKAREGALLMHNLLDYEEKQLQKIHSMEKVFRDLEGQKSSELQGRAGKKFITQQDYDWHILKENFTFKSPIFKHAARLTIAMLVGFSIGTIFAIQNAYWILLTIVVIMRPGYTLTKERSRQRLYGTLIGAAIAALIVLLSQNSYLYAFLAIFSLMLAFTFIQRNYRTSSIFVTTSVIFIYALINPDAFEVIQFRIIDTITGAAISMLAISFLWPAWEIQSIKTVISKALESNRNYLLAIDAYHHQTQDITHYKLARKEAFLEMGNLNAAFQRMSQEPESRQQDLSKLYEIVGLNHTLLTAAAALGTYITSKKEAVVTHSFELVMENIELNLTQAVQTLQHKEVVQNLKEEKLQEAYGHLEERFEELVAIRNRELAEQEDKPIDPEFRKSLQEARLISDQLKWLVSISGNLKKLIRELEYSAESPEKSASS